MLYRTNNIKTDENQLTLIQNPNSSGDLLGDVNMQLTKNKKTATNAKKSLTIHR